MWIKYDSLCWACWTENWNMFLAKQGHNIANNPVWGKKHIFTVAFLLYWSHKLHGFCLAIALRPHKAHVEWVCMVKRTLSCESRMVLSDGVKLLWRFTIKIVP